MRLYKRNMVSLDKISQEQQEIVEEFSMFEGEKEQSVEYIMDLGMEMEMMVPGITELPTYLILIARSFMTLLLGHIILKILMTWQLL